MHDIIIITPFYTHCVVDGRSDLKFSSMSALLQFLSLFDRFSHLLLSVDVNSKAGGKQDTENLEDQQTDASTKSNVEITTDETLDLTEAAVCVDALLEAGLGGV